MKKMFLLLLPLLAAGWLLSLGGCGKCKGIEGTVLEFGTDKPIPDASVTLSECEGELLGNFTCTDLAYATTDSDGRFDFGQDGFAVSAKATDYWDTGDDFVMVTNECPKPVLYLYPHAWLQVTAKNVSGALRFDASGFDENLTWISLSKGQDTVFTMFTRGNSTYSFRYGFQKDISDVGTWLDTAPVFVDGHKTTKITITF